jgi:hypothetical protein
MNLQNNQSFMSLYDYMYFIWDRLHSAFYTSVRCSNTKTYYSVLVLMSEILLY